MTVISMRKNRRIQRLSLHEGYVQTFSHPSLSMVRMYHIIVEFRDPCVKFGNGPVVESESRICMNKFFFVGILYDSVLPELFQVMSLLIVLYCVFPRSPKIEESARVESTFNSVR
jgi:hypothetical protein